MIYVYVINDNVSLMEAIHASKWSENLSELKDLSFSYGFDPEGKYVSYIITNMSWSIKNLVETTERRILAHQSILTNCQECMLKVCRMIHDKEIPSHKIKFVLISKTEDKQGIISEDMYTQDGYFIAEPKIGLFSIRDNMMP